MPLTRVLLLCSYRPGYPNPFPERSYITRATLAPLSEEESIRLAEGMLATSGLAVEFRQVISRRAEGNPFFVEELVRALLETGVLRREQGGYVADQTACEARVPETVQAVIMGRIDRLPAGAKKALQLASVIGREFNFSLLATLVELNEPLGESLQQLRNAELIYERSLLPEPRYVFKHALTQDVAYDSLRLQQRKELHRLVAAAVEELYAERLPEHCGMLAYHYERGEEWERALNYLDLAAESARRLGARRDEAALLGRAIAIAERHQERAVVGRLRARRGRAFIDIALWIEARPELEAALDHFDPNDSERRAEALTGWAWSSIWLFDRAGSIRYANDALPVATQARREDLAADALGSLAMVETADGHHDQARTLFQQAIQRAGGADGRVAHLRAAHFLRLGTIRRRHPPGAGGRAVVPRRQQDHGHAAGDVALGLEPGGQGSLRRSRRGLRPSASLRPTVRDLASVGTLHFDVVGLPPGPVRLFGRRDLGAGSPRAGALNEFSSGDPQQ